MKTKVLYFYAMWDNHAMSKLDNFCEEVKRLKAPFRVIDVETPDGVALSIKHGVRSVPVAVYINNKKEVSRDKGNDLHTRIKYHLQCQ